MKQKKEDINQKAKKENNMETKTGYEEVHRTESFGTKGHFKLRILLDIGRDLTDTDKSNIRDCAEKLKEAINQETWETDKEHIQEGLEEREKLLQVFAGREIFVETIPNEYMKGWHNWYVVTTKSGRIKIGWRKRVIEIDWTDSPILFQAKDLFTEEDVTKEGKSIHAWSYEKAKEYIDRLLSIENGNIS